MELTEDALSSVDINQSCHYPSPLLGCPSLGGEGLYSRMPQIQSLPPEVMDYVQFLTFTNAMCMVIEMQMFTQ